MPNIKILNRKFSNLRKGIAVSSTSRIVSLSPFVDHNQHLRARGQLFKALRLEIARFPLILEGNNQSVRLKVKYIYQTNMHCGTEQTRNLLMELYWILRCRAVVKQTVRQCIPCRRIIQKNTAPKWLTSKNSDYHKRTITFFKPQVRLHRTLSS